MPDTSRTPAWRSWLHDPPERLGRRGAILLIGGLAWLVFGAAAVTRDVEFDPASGILYLAIPGPIRAALWASTGLLAIGYAWRRRPCPDSVGFAALIVMPIERAFSYAWSWVAHLVGDPGQGYAEGWQEAAFWLLVVAFILTCAGWQEPPSSDAEHRCAS